MKVLFVSTRKNSSLEDRELYEMEFMNELLGFRRSLLDLGLEHKILEKKGAWIAYEGALVGQGRDAAKAALKEKPELAEKIAKAVLEKVTVTGGAVITGGNGAE